MGEREEKMDARWLEARMRTEGKWGRAEEFLSLFLLPANVTNGTTGANIFKLLHLVRTYQI